jgi:hypothetical protein
LPEGLAADLVFSLIVSIADGLHICQRLGNLATKVASFIYEELSNINNKRNTIPRRVGKTRNGNAVPLNNPLGVEDCPPD